MTTHKVDAARQARALLRDLDENGIGDDERTLARTVGRLDVVLRNLLQAHHEDVRRYSPDTEDVDPPWEPEG